MLEGAARDAFAANSESRSQDSGALLPDILSAANARARAGSLLQWPPVVCTPLQTLWNPTTLARPPRAPGRGLMRDAGSNTSTASGIANLLCSAYTLLTVRAEGWQDPSLALAGSGTSTVNDGVKGQSICRYWRPQWRRRGDPEQR